MEWYHVCWPRLTAKRVKPVVSISWASCTLHDVPQHIIQHRSDDRLRGLGVARGRISRFPIDLRRRPYNTLALPCECVIELTVVLEDVEGDNTCLGFPSDIYPLGFPLLFWYEWNFRNYARWSIKKIVNIFVLWAAAWGRFLSFVNVQGMSIIRKGNDVTHDSCFIG